MSLYEIEDVGAEIVVDSFEILLGFLGRHEFLESHADLKGAFESLQFVH